MTAQILAESIVSLMVLQQALSDHQRSILGSIELKIFLVSLSSATLMVVQ